MCLIYISKDSEFWRITGNEINALTLCNVCPELLETLVNSLNHRGLERLEVAGVDEDAVALTFAAAGGHLHDLKVGVALHVLTGIEVVAPGARKLCLGE